MKPKGYLIASGYMGYINGRYIQFETEDEYIARLRENETES